LLVIGHSLLKQHNIILFMKLKRFDNTQYNYIVYKSGHRRVISIYSFKVISQLYTQYNSIRYYEVRNKFRQSTKH